MLRREEVERIKEQYPKGINCTPCQGHFELV